MLTIGDVRGATQPGYVRTCMHLGIKLVVTRSRTIFDVDYERWSVTQRLPAETAAAQHVHVCISVLSLSSQEAERPEPYLMLTMGEVRGVTQPGYVRTCMHLGSPKKPHHTGVCKIIAHRATVSLPYNVAYLHRVCFFLTFTASCNLQR
jgi:hypothetical protein